jgi:ABC-type multidrug transport system fused ATPase/permease subunit
MASLLKAFKLLERKQKLSWLSALLAQGILSLLDLLGVFLVGLTATISVRGIQGSAYGTRIETVLSTLRINELTLQGQVFFLASLTLLLFTSKTILSAYLTRRMIRFFCMQGAFISYKLFRNSLNRSNFTKNQKNIQQSVYAILTGVNAITQGIYIQSMQIFTDALLLIILVLGIFLIEPVAAISLLFVFGVTAAVLALALGKKAGENSRQATQLTTQCSMHIELSFSSFRDIYARGALEWATDEYSVNRNELARRDAKLRFLPLQSKFIMETVMVSSVFLVAGIHFLKFTGSTAIGFLSIFLAATLRISPAILRIQQAYLSLRGALSSSYLTFDLIEESKLDDSKNQEKAIASNAKSKMFSDTKDSALAIKTENLSFRYVSSRNILQNVSFEIPNGSKVLVFGESGSGKSTLLDLILGILVPSDGNVHLFGENPRNFILRNPGKISYVTQRLWIPGGKIRDCLNFGFSSIWPERDLLAALEITKLHEALPYKSSDLLDFDIGPYGSKLSGGQLQRLGVSRALLGNPKILILDESTNALDVQSESEIIENVYRNLSESTIIAISHRPSFVAQYSNLFLRLDRGRVSKSDSFALSNGKDSV